MKKNCRAIAIVLTLLMVMGMLSACAGRSYKSSDKKYTSEMLTINGNSGSNTTETIQIGTPRTEVKYVSAGTDDNNGSNTPSGGNDTPSGGNDTPSGDNGNGDNGDNGNGDNGNTDNEPDNGNDTPIDDGGDDRDWTTSCMSFNVLMYDTHNTGYAAPVTRSDWIIDTVKNYTPDLLGMQEVTKAESTTQGFDMYAKLVDAFGGSYSHRALIDEKGAAVAKLTIGSGLVIFWKTARFELKDSGCKVYTKDAGRHYQWVKLYDTQEKVTIVMTNTHLSINPGSDSAAGQVLRNAEAGELYAFWNKNCDDKTPLYATGDYNHRTSEPAYNTLSQGDLASSRDVANKSNADSSIDFVYINNQVQDCYEYHRCNETYETGKGVVINNGNDRNAAFCPSDHYAIIAYCSNAYL